MPYTITDKCTMFACWTAKGWCVQVHADATVGYIWQARWLTKSLILKFVDNIAICGYMVKN